MNDIEDKQNILALDLGEAKVGLAFSEKETGIAFSLGIVKNDAEFWKKLKEIIEEKDIERIIIGNPKWNEENSRAKKMAEKIRNSFSLSVEIVEEMFTTKMAKENLKEAGKKNIAQDDAEAARIMLEDWLIKNA